MSAPGLPGNASRYSYSAVSLSNDSLLVYGGFRGETYRDVLEYRKGQCNTLFDRDNCLSSLCRWANSTCVDIDFEMDNSKCSL